MDYFGLKNLNELPKPRDFKEPESQIGEKAPIEEAIQMGIEQQIEQPNPPDQPTESTEPVQPAQPTDQAESPEPDEPQS